MAHLALLFPTGTEPRSPYLALPCLAAHLRQAGISVSMQDLDIGGLRALVEPNRLGSAIRSFQQQTPVHSTDSATRRLLGLSESLPERAREALAVFRDPERFFQPPEFAAARDTLLDCLDLCSASVSERLHYNISPVQYDINGVDPQNLKDLEEATRDDRWNLFSDYWEESVYPRLATEQPLAVGITITNRQQILPGLTLARRLRERGHFVVLGGALYSKFVDRLRCLPEFFQFFADGVVAYEGETALIELVAALEAGRDLSRAPNLLYLKAGQVVMNRTHVEDVERLPCPDFDGLPLADYLTPEPVLPLYFGKGCYFNRCKFCDIPYINHISRKAYRLRSPETIASDLHQLRRRLGCSHFEFIDEALPPRTLEHLADALENSGQTGFNFVGYARLEPAFTAELCHRLANMGMRKLFFGLESGSQHTLDHMDKGISITDVPIVLRNCMQAGINFHLFSIVGFPEETEEHAGETFGFFEQHVDLIDSPGNSFDIHPFGLELRTAYAAEAEPLGVLISPAALAKDFVIGPGREWTNSRGLSHEDVERLVVEFNDGLRRIYKRFHAGPGHLWPGYEEFAVLYSSHYRGREFPYRTSLPEEQNLNRYRLRWNPSVWVDRDADGQLCGVHSRHGNVGMTPDSLALVNRGVRLPAGELVDLLCGGGDEPEATRTAIIDILNEWIANGLLQLIPLQAEPAYHRGERIA